MYFLKETDNSSIGIFSTPQYVRAQIKTMDEVKAFLYSLSEILWSLYRIEWWRTVMSRAVKISCLNIKLPEFPINYVEIQLLLIKEQSLAELIRAAKPYEVKTIGTFSFFHYYLFIISA